MPIEFTIPGPLRPLAAGRGRVRLEASPSTVAEALEALWSLHPGLKDRVLTEEGHIRTHVNLFVDADNVRDLSGLATPLPAACEIAILPAISGGKDELKIDD
jgi:molybdopterin converting factor small subunit